MARENKANRQMRRMAEHLAASLQVTQETFSQHSGPLPDPQTLAGYNQLIPGLADRIVSMAESEAVHRRELEKTFLDAQIADQGKGRSIEHSGQVCALVISLAAIIGGVVVISKGYPITGSILSGGTIITLAGLFIYGREKKPSNDKPGKNAGEASTAIEKRIE